MADRPPRHMPPALQFPRPVAVGPCQQTTTKPTEKTRTAGRIRCPLAETADSFGISPRLFLLFPAHGHEREREPLPSGEMAPPGETAGGGAPFGSPASVVELLDDYWCFRNVLGRGPLRARASTRGGGGGSSCSHEPDVASDATIEGEAAKLPGIEDAAVPRSLLRTPSMPPRLERERPAAQEGARPHRTGGGGSKLRHSYSNLESVLPLLPSGRHHPKCTAGALSRRSPSDGKVQSMIRYVNGHHRAITGVSRGGAFRVKKWRSFSDLETEEVEGLRDLGFVFDNAVVNPSVAQVVPGLRDRLPAAHTGGGEAGTGDVPRPYLSEAWVAQRSAPPALDWVAGNSAADVKEQLRFWAQVVASNVRQEC